MFAQITKRTLARRSPATQSIFPSFTRSYATAGYGNNVGKDQVDPCKSAPAKSPTQNTPAASKSSKSEEEDVEKYQTHTHRFKNAHSQSDGTADTNAERDQKSGSSKGYGGTNDGVGAGVPPIRDDSHRGPMPRESERGEGKRRGGL